MVEFRVDILTEADLFPLYISSVCGVHLDSRYPSIPWIAKLFTTVAITHLPLSFFLYAVPEPHIYVQYLPQIPGNEIQRC